MILTRSLFKNADDWRSRLESAFVINTDTANASDRVAPFFKLVAAKLLLFSSALISAGGSKRSGGISSLPSRY